MRNVKTGKRALSYILTAMMLLTLLPAVTPAARAADIDVSDAVDLADALFNAGPGDTIKLANDIEYSGAVTLEDGITLDLNGKTLTVRMPSDAYGEAALTVEDGAEVGNEAGITGDIEVIGPESTAPPSDVIGVKAEDNGSDVTVAGNLIVSGETGWTGLSVTNGAKVTIIGGITVTGAGAVGVFAEGGGTEVIVEGHIDVTGTGGVGVFAMGANVTVGGGITAENGIVISPDGSKVTVEGAIAATEGIIAYNGAAPFNPAFVEDGFEIEDRQNGGYLVTYDGGDVYDSEVWVRNKQDATVNASPDGWTYDGGPHDGYKDFSIEDGAGEEIDPVPGYTVIYEAFNGVTYDPIVSAPTDAGDYRAIITINADQPYWGSKTVDFTVAKADPGTPAGLTATYGDALDDVTLPDGWAWDAPGTTPVGNAGRRTHDASYTDAGSAAPGNHEDAANVPLRITVYRAAGVFGTPSDIEATYTPGLTLADLEGYLPAGYTWDDATTEVYAGDGQDFPATYTESRNHRPAGGDITVNAAKAPVAITQLPDIDEYHEYNGEPLDEEENFTGETDNGDPYDEGFVFLYEGDGDTNYGPTDEPPTDAGAYSVTVSVPDGNANYTGSWVFSIVIHPKEVTVTAGSWTITQGDALPAPTVTYQGFIGSDSEDNALDAEAVARLNVPDSHTVGTSVVDFAAYAVLNDGIGANYRINPDPEASHIEGTLTIEAPPPAGGSGAPPAPVIRAYGGADPAAKKKYDLPITDKEGVITPRYDVKIRDALMADAKACAEADGGEPVITYDVNRNGAKAVGISMESARAIGGAGTAVTFKLPGADVTLPSETLAALAAMNGGAAITVEAAVVLEEDLTKMQAAQVKGYGPVVNINVSVGDEKVSVPVTVSLPYTLKDGEDPAAVRVWRMDENGKLTGLDGVYDPDAGRITFTAGRQSYFVAGYDPVALWENIFDDLSPEDMYYEAIAFMNQKGLMAGYGNGNAGPEDTLSRAQFATLLWNLEGQPLPEGTAPFDDVAEGAWYYNPVIWAAENGIVAGTGGGLFDPNTPIKRQQVAQMLYNYAVNFKGYEIPENRPTPEYADNDQIDAWARTAVKALSEAGVLRDDGAFRPLADATRGEAAEMFRNFLRFVAGE